MAISTILWRRLDRPGHESAWLSENAGGIVLEGTAVFGEAGQPCRLDYRVVCDREWRTQSALVIGWLDRTRIDLDIAVDEERNWTLNRRPCPGVQGCEDLDLSFSPATNLLAIRRLHVAVGARAAVRAAWLRFPDTALDPLDQIYERLDESRYRYESGGGAFTAVLETNAAGFVTRYPGLWEAADRVGSERDGSEMRRE
jgi:hypothetical protein